MGPAHPHNKYAAGRRRPACPRRAGFTLPELLITVAIVSILAALAGPSYSNLIASQRARTASTELYLALAKARSEAIKRNTNVTLSPKSGDWKNGWEILNPSDATAKLEDHNAVSGMTITGPASVVYQSTGRIRGNTRPAFDFSVADASAAACVTVDLSGLPVQKSSSC